MAEEVSRGNAPLNGSLLVRERLPTNPRDPPSYPQIGKVLRLGVALHFSVYIQTPKASLILPSRWALGSESPMITTCLVEGS